ncbi:PAS domain-containing sensor histidine kinase [Kordiimonas marina]|uniref:PAS domain-containing sensor histidine kinase n=1 Tax=Kordiimonas marina TaxID=2872312 RepID=UPI001FF6F256|nr:PAS domain-containing protein [Kordiimonas marina]MCJ9428182.1 PAS domain-containing protein [Kordiimonas marina]
MTQGLQPLISELIDIAQDAFLVVTADGNIVFANNGARDLTGYDREDLIGMSIDMLIPKQRRAAHAGLFKSFVDSGQETYLMSRRGTVPLLGKGDHIYEVGATISRKMVDGQLYFGVILTDLSPLKTALQYVVDREIKLKQSLEQLERAEERFVLAQQLAQIGSWDWQIANGELFWSDEVYRIFGMEPQVLTPTYDIFLSFIHPDDRAAVEAAVARSLEDPAERYDINHRIVRPDGEIRTVREIGKAQMDKDGKPRLMIGSVQDITESESLQEQMASALIRETEANRSKSEFLANLSHELRTPLNAVIGYSSLIATLPKTDAAFDKIEEYAGDINMAGTHLSELVEDILEMSKVDLGIVDLHEDDVDLENVIHAVQTMANGRANERGVILRTKIAPALPRVTGDALRIKQVLLNLIVNSIKFTDSGGWVHVDAYERDDGGVRVSVADNGCGMEKNRIEDAIKKFTKLHSPLKSQYQGGLGLGLSMAKAYCDLHEADLTIESDPGQGTTVFVDFPPSRTIGPP